MELTANDVKTFQKLYSDQFGINLTDKLARKKLLILVRQVELVYRTITQAQLDQLDDVDGNENYEQGRPANNS